MPRQKLTPWFDADVKPAQPGVYERQTLFSGDSFYSRWNGQFWCVGQFSIDRAAKQRDRSLRQKRPWRGLAENPHA